MSTKLLCPLHTINTLIKSMTLATAGRVRSEVALYLYATKHGWWSEVLKLPMPPFYCIH